MNEDWMQLTPEQYDLISSKGPEETCLYFGEDLIRVPTERFLAAFKHAFETGAQVAAGSLGISNSAGIESFDLEAVEMGQKFLRVLVTSTDGRTASGVGVIPDPRSMH